MPRTDTNPIRIEDLGDVDGLAEALAHKGGLLLSMPRSILLLCRYRRMFLSHSQKLHP
jgi:hypothetical protein